MSFAAINESFFPWASPKNQTVVTLASYQNMDSIMTIFAYLSSAFILIPAGRDILNFRLNLLPGEKKTRPLLMAKDPEARTFMWGVWGLNHCALSLLKLWAIYDDDEKLLAFLTCTAAMTFIYLVRERKAISRAGGDVDGFVVVCGLQSVSLAYLAFM